MTLSRRQSTVAIAVVAVAVAMPRSRVPIRRGLGKLVSVAGFVVHSIWDVAAHGFFAKAAQWDKALSSLDLYLTESGIGQELKKSITHRFPPTVALLSRVQEILPNERTKGAKPLSLFQQQAKNDDKLPSWKEAARIMRFATAVYGLPMIQSVELELDLFQTFAATDQEAVLRHTGIPREQDLWIANALEYGTGGDGSLRHLVAVDHEHKQVILAIRGTYDLTGVVVDVAAFAKPFCGGLAHAGMAAMARSLLDRRAIQQLNEKAEQELSANHGYELVITGHSLGAGVATLVTMLILHEKLVSPEIPVRCFAFAPPPVFAPLSLEIAKQTQKHVTAYVYGHDVVPTMSVSSFRHLFHQIVALDRASQGLWWWNMVAMTRQWRPVIPHMSEAVQEARSAPPPEKKGAPLLAILAQHVVWLPPVNQAAASDSKRKSSTMDETEPLVCHPLAFAKAGMWMHPDMVNDHMTPQYQLALNLMAAADEKETP